MAEIQIILTPINGIKRKATFEALVYNRRARTVTTQWKVTLVEDVQIGVDEEEQPILEEREITAPWYKPYTKEFIADETLMVNPQTGAILNPETDNMEGAVSEFYYFSEIVAENAVVVNQLIAAVGAQKASEGKFEYA